MSFSMSSTRIFTVLLAAGSALANPIARPQPASPDLGSGIPTASGLTITSLSYFGDGCPEGSLQGLFCPETSSFNVTISELKAILQDGKSSDDASCHIEVGFKTEAQIQLNLLQGDFYGSCYLESEGMTALAHSSVSFAGNSGGSNIPWLFYGPIDTKAVYEHNLLEVFVSQCSTGGDFLMLIDLVLHVTRGPAPADAVGYIDIDQLTGAISQAYILQPSPCGMTIETKPPSSTQQQSGGSYGKEVAKETKKKGKTSKTSSSSNEEEKKKKEEEEKKYEEEQKKKQEEEKKKYEEEEKKKKEEEEKKKYEKEQMKYEEEQKKKYEEEEKKKYEEEEKKKYEEEQKKKYEEEEKKKSTSGGSSGCGGGGGCGYNYEEIEKKKSGGTCGQKCAYTPCSEEEENKKITEFSEYEKTIYYESKKSYKLSLEIDYKKQTKNDQSTTDHNNDLSRTRLMGEGGSKPKCDTELCRTRLMDEGGSKPKCETELCRTRLMSGGGEKSKSEEEKKKKKDKCKRDGSCGQ